VQQQQPPIEIARALLRAAFGALRFFATDFLATFFLATFFLAGAFLALVADLDFVAFLALLGMGRILPPGSFAGKKGIG
jgi:hypothetical protein